MFRVVFTDSPLKRRELQRIFHIYIYICAYIFIYIYVYIYIHIYIYLFIYIYTYINLYTFIHIYKFTFVYINIYIQVAYKRRFAPIETSSVSKDYCL